MITDFQKRIYNCYLRNYRKGEPFKYRQNFSNLNPNIFAALEKISTFLTRYNHIDCDDYFDAFNELHPDDKYPPLTFFYSRGALKNYAIYQKQKEDRNPEKQFEEIKKSMKFIGLFCIANKINLDDYLSHKTSYMYSWLNHYREHRINPYCLFVLGNAFSILDTIPKDELQLFTNNLYDNLLSYHNRYNNSKTTQDFIQRIYKTVKGFVTNELTK
jgi:hypothetical protein